MSYVDRDGYTHVDDPGEQGPDCEPVQEDTIYDILDGMLAVLEALHNSGCHPTRRMSIDTELSSLRLLLSVQVDKR